MTVRNVGEKAKDIDAEQYGGGEGSARHGGGGQGVLIDCVSSGSFHSITNIA